jgi:hypothetical protein
MTARRLGLVLIPLCLTGCFADSKPDNGNHSSPAPTAASPFEEKLLAIAQSYEEYGRLDLTARWAPAACAPAVWAPPAPEPRFSASGDGGTHGRKLYYLFVKELPKDTPDPEDYTRGDQSAVGQVIVKEAWVPEEAKDDGKPLEPVKRTVQVGGKPRADEFLPYARKDGRLYHAKEKAALFIMMKLDPKTPDTDAGWVYATATPDGKKLTGAGRIESCMGCHQTAPHDRLFGLAKQPPDAPPTP